MKAAAGKLAGVGVLLYASWCASAQVPFIKVYSEFQRVDPFGKILAVDQPKNKDIKPREILSPGVPRNGHSTFRVAITLPEGSEYTMWVAQNPENVFEVTIYREIFASRGNQWIPQSLEPVSQPVRGGLPSPLAAVSGQTTVTYLIDLFTPASRPVFRARVEVQLYCGGAWYIYPMEVRILPATIPQHETVQIAMPSAAEPADAPARRVLAGYLCGALKPGPVDLTTPFGIMIRNLSQDVALARAVEQQPGARLIAELVRLAGQGGGKNWCSSPVYPEELGPEWYLRLRDFLYRLAE